jgi:selenocysteine-specific elongation factor
MFVIGTAGHIDHGKSALVRAMTGIDPDRLPEEKERGMTIDLGFAWADLPSGKTIGIVDVPGHERFVKNMVAGVGGIDAVILVIAADDGWMPQTEEHFDIIQLLNIKTGLVALAKKDIVDEEFLELQIEDIKERLQGSFLENCPIIPVSGITGDGVDDLKKSLDSILTEINPKPDIGAPRLFIDRRFTVQGIGTVVTGTLLEGNLKIDQQVEVLPSGLASRIRNLQTHKEKITEATPGSRVAVNLVGLERTEINRGDAVCAPETVSPTNRIAAEITLLGRTRLPLKNGFEVTLILGTADINARIYLLESYQLKPGESAFARIHLLGPVAAKIGDKFVIRRISPQDTIGGGVVLDTDVIIGRKKKDLQIKVLKNRSDLKPSSLIKSKFLISPRIKLNDLSDNLPFPKAELEDIIKSLQQSGEIVVSGPELISRNFLEKFADPAVEIISNDHNSRPWSDGMEPGTLAKKLKIDPERLPDIIDFLVATNKIVSEKGFLKIKGHTASLKSDQLQLQGKLISRLSASPLTAPIRKQFIDDDPKYEIVINFLRYKGDIIELKGGILFTNKDFENIVNSIKGFLKETKRAKAADIKNHLNTSRKYIIPILERLDQMGVTVRDGDFRVLGSG